MLSLEKRCYEKLKMCGELQKIVKETNDTTNIAKIFRGRVTLSRGCLCLAEITIQTRVLSRSKEN